MADRSNLVPQIITNSNGVQTTVWVNPEQQGSLTGGNPLTAIGTPILSNHAARLSLNPEERQYADELGIIENIYDETSQMEEFVGALAEAGWKSPDDKVGGTRDIGRALYETWTDYEEIHERMTSRGIHHTSHDEDMKALLEDEDVAHYAPVPLADRGDTAMAQDIVFVYNDGEEGVYTPDGGVTKASLNNFFRGHFKEEYGVEIEITSNTGRQDLVNGGNWPRGTVTGAPHDLHRFLRAYENGSV